jgi:hypothetical protein
VDPDKGLVVVPGVSDLVAYPRPFGCFGPDEHDDCALVLHLLRDPISDRLLAASVDRFMRVEERSALYHTHVDDLLDPPSIAVVVKAVKDSQHRLGGGWVHTDQRALSR